jgi:hypothetical protein
MQFKILSVCSTVIIVYLHALEKNPSVVFQLESVTVSSFVFVALLESFLAYDLRCLRRSA